MKTTNIEELIQDISEPRLKTYKDVDNFSDVELLSFYFKIQEISSHFFVPIQILEIILRNRLNHELKILNNKRRNWTKENWYETIEGELSKKSKDMLKNAMSKSKGGSEGDLIANITFGFWVYLLDAQHSDNKNPLAFWQYIEHKVFPDKKNKNLKEIFNILKRVNKVRNRLYHYEPIWKETKPRKLSKKIVISKMMDEYNKIYEAIGIISSEKKILMEKMDFKSKFEECCQNNVFFQ